MVDKLAALKSRLKTVSQAPSYQKKKSSSSSGGGGSSSSGGSRRSSSNNTVIDNEEEIQGPNIPTASIYDVPGPGSSVIAPPTDFAAPLSEKLITEPKITQGSTVKNTNKYRTGGSRNVTSGSSTHSRPPPRPDVEYSVSEYQSKIQSNIRDISDYIGYKGDLKTAGQRLIDFSTKDMVEIDGVMYPGNELMYTVSDFNPKYIPAGVKFKPHDKYVVLTASQYEVYAEKLGRSFIRQSEDIDEKSLFDIKREYESEYLRTYDFHPDIKIHGFKTDEGYKYEYKLPFTGAENYFSYKSMLEKDPTLATTLGWGWGGLGNVDIAYYKLTGQNEKAIQKQIGQLSTYDQARKTLASGDVVGFSGQYWSGYLRSPATQIGIAAAGGYGIGKYLTIKSTVAAATTGKVASSMVTKAIVGGATTVLMGSKIKGIADIAMSGDVGRAIGESWLFGTSVVAGVAGFQSGQAAGRIAAEPKITEYFSQHPEKLRFYHYHPGHRVDYDIEGRINWVKGVPTEKGRASIRLVELYKPGKDIIATTSRYNTGLQEYVSARSFKPNLGMNVVGDTVQPTINLESLNFQKLVVDMPIKGSIVRSTQWITKFFRTGQLPFGGISRTIQIPKSTFIPPAKNILFPVSNFLPSNISFTASAGISSIINKSSQMLEPRYEVATKPKLNVISIPGTKTIQIPKIGLSYKPQYNTVQTPKFDVIQTPKFTQIYKPKFDIAQKPQYELIKVPQFSPTPSFTTTSPPYFPLLDFGVEGGRGAGGGYYMRFFKGYRYRKWKVPSMEDFLKGGI